MIISVNSKTKQVEFDKLLNSTIEELSNQAKHSSKQFKDLLGRNIEPYIKDLMSDLSIGTSFENTIELIGGQKFPDIVANKYYGVEVKTTTQNHWKTTGNSVLEGTRIESVERIYMLFAKLASPIEFRCRPYEEVLSEVVVTHSPRYLIDMNLEKGRTIFDKIELPYDTLRKSDNPIKPIVDYYKSKLKSGEDLWWIDNDTKSNKFVIRIWNHLSLEERLDLKKLGMIYFPELFGNSGDKFGSFGVWLVKQESIICPNIRDIYTAGGRGDYSYGKSTIKNIPRIIINLFESAIDCVDIILKTESYELSEYWGQKTNDQTKVLDWINLVSEYCCSIQDLKNLDVKKVLTNIITRNK